MAHELFRLLSDVVNQPQLATPTYMEFAIQFITERSGKPEMAIGGAHPTEEAYLQYNSDTRTGVLPILGPLTYTPMYGLCGEVGYSYQRIQSDFDSMLALGAKTILMDLDTPGGLAYGCFETANYLRKTADAAGVKIIAYVDGMAASAGYGLAAAAHEIIANPFAEVGSIGVVVSLANVSKAEKKMGIERTYVYAGDAKIPFDKEGNFAEGFLKDIQDKVDTLYLSFIKHVSELRNLSQDDVKNTQAKTFTADVALKLGLVDAVMDREEFFTYLSDTVESGNTMSLNLFGRKEKLTANEGADVATLTELQTAHTALQAAHEGVQAELASVNAILSTKDAELAEMAARALAAESKLAEIEAAKELAAEQEKQAKLDARKKELSEILGDEEGEALFAAVGTLDDAAYGLMVKGMQKKLNVENDSPMFTEMGVGGAGKSKESLTIEEDATTRLLKQQYKTK